MTKKIAKSASTGKFVKKSKVKTDKDTTYETDGISRRRMQRQVDIRIFNAQNRIDRIKGNIVLFSGNGSELPMINIDRAIELVDAILDAAIAAKNELAGADGLVELLRSNR